MQSRLQSETLIYLQRLRTYNGKGFGKHIYLEFKHNGTTYYAQYAHLDEIKKNLKVGDVVKRGDILGKTGTTGYKPEDKADEHLHFGIAKKTSPGEGLKNYYDPAILFGPPPLKKPEQ